jgi:hypothetical protein
MEKDYYGFGRTLCLHLQINPEDGGCGLHGVTPRRQYSSVLLQLFVFLSAGDWLSYMHCCLCVCAHAVVYICL